MLIRRVHCVVLILSALIALVAISRLGRPGITLLTLVAPEAFRLDFATTSPALPFLALIALVVPGVALWGLRRGAPADGTRLAFFVVTMVGVFLAQSIAAFFLAWETMSLMSAFLIAAHHERRDVRRALLAYLIVSQLGAFCIVTALALLGAHAGSAQFPVMAHAAGTLSDGMRSAVLILALVGFGSKAGLVPLHFWLPRAHPVAPANASALLSGVMLSVAVYGLLVVGFVLAAPVGQGWSLVILALGLATAVTGALYAAVETDIKRLLAYSSIENIGIIVSTLGLALAATAWGLSALAELGLVALLLHVLAHGVFKALLFLGAGTVSEAAHTTDLDRLGGLGRVLPFTTPLVLVGALAAAALPPLCGFASEWLVFQSFIRGLATAPLLLQAVLAVAVTMLALTSGLAAAAFAKFFGIGFLGSPRTTHPVEPEALDASVAGLGWLAAVAAVLGLAPALAVGPLIGIARELSGNVAVDTGALNALPSSLIALPLLGAAAAVLLARFRGVRAVPTWTCGSNVTVRAQYTAVAFSKPLRRIFAFVLKPGRQRVVDAGGSRWFPVRIRYAVATRDTLDELARTVAAFVQRLARRLRVVQAGRLRVYVAYAVVAIAVLLVAAR
jgi:hydrogenase-4 component B